MASLGGLGLIQAKSLRGISDRFALTLGFSAGSHHRGTQEAMVKSSASITKSKRPLGCMCLTIAGLYGGTGFPRC